jgi:hypothetical protein
VTDDRVVFVRELCSREVAPLIRQCLSMRAGIDGAEAILLDPRAREAARAESDQLRARVEALITECNELSDKVLRLARERYPSWGM